jgi:hypothetical protein
MVVGVLLYYSVCCVLCVAICVLPFRRALGRFDVSSVAAARDSIQSSFYSKELIQYDWLLAVRAHPTRKPARKPDSSMILL